MTPARLNVTVAVLPPFELVFEMDNAPKYGTPWAHLPKVSVEARPDQTLRDVLAEACDRAGVRLTRMHREATESFRREEQLPLASGLPADELVYVQFRLPDDDEVADPQSEDPVLRRDTRGQVAHVITRDDEGRAVWQRPGLDATMADLVDASKVGLIDGDPLNPYLNPSIPQGDFGAVQEWLSFGNALKALWQVTGVASEVGGALALLEMLRRRRGKQVADVVDRRMTEWTERGAAPSDLLRFLASKPRATAEVASLLGCPEAEAEAMLWGFGFVYDEVEAVWRHRGDAVARLIADDIELTFADLISVGRDEELLRELATVRLERLLTSGEPPAIAEARSVLHERTLERVDYGDDNWIQQLRRRIGSRLRRARTR